MGLCIGREREMPGEGEEEEEDLKAPVPRNNSSPSLASQKLTHSRPSMTGTAGGGPGSRASTPSACAVTTKLMSNGSSRTASPMHHGSLVSPAAYGSQVGCALCVVRLLHHLFIPGYNEMFYSVLSWLK